MLADFISHLSLISGEEGTSFEKVLAAFRRLSFAKIFPFEYSYLNSKKND